jgi:peptidoglycan/xylan/chitin deacetylase (PgdA/CDA1 family)
VLRGCGGEVRPPKPPAPPASAGPPAPTPTATVPARPDDVPQDAPKPQSAPADLLKSADGLPPVISSIPTGGRTVFLTIDDGQEKDPEFVDEIRRWRIPITAFLTRDAVEEKWDYFRGLRDAGAHIADHTLTHPNLRLYGPEAQKQEICGMRDRIKEEFGARPLLFRPPFGNYNTATREVAGECGIKAILLWKESVQPHGRIAYQEPDQKLRDGDIILMHFRPHLGPDFRKVLRHIADQDFQLGDLADYLPIAEGGAR